MNDCNVAPKTVENLSIILTVFPTLSQEAQTALTFFVRGLAFQNEINPILNAHPSEQSSVEQAS